MMKATHWNTSPGSRKSVVTLGMIAALVGAVDCSRRESSPRVDDPGEFRFSLTLSSLAHIDTVNYKVSGNGIVPVAGHIDVSMSNVATAVVTGLPAATGYLVEADAV